MNNLFENNYSKYIEPIYGEKRKILQDDIINSTINNSHEFNIYSENREDFTNMNVYSIDPIDCVDADDAFSLYEKNNKLFLIIHIADPTEYIPLHSNLWKDISSRVTTKYLSNRKPIHMMPEKLLEYASLMENSKGNIKNAISVFTEIDKISYLPINKVKLLFSKITVSKQNAYNYSNANIENPAIISIGLKIGEALKNKRSLHTKGSSLSELFTAHPIYQNDEIKLYKDEIIEKKTKQMIAEFAIFANSFVGEYLKVNINKGIFRTCNAKEWLDTINYKISGEEMLQEIITNGISAEYLSTISSHDLIGAPEYCHFTSPIRRLSDCVCHYLLKYIYLRNNKKKINIPFNEIELNELANKCVNASKKDKKNQYMDIKFRLIQVIANLIEKNKKVEIKFYITNYSGLFLNLIICNIDEFHVHMSYSLKIKNYNNNIDKKEKHCLMITNVNCFTKYDENTIPELDSYLINYIKR